MMNFNKNKITFLAFVIGPGFCFLGAVCSMKLLLMSAAATVAAGYYFFMMITLLAQAAVLGEALTLACCSLYFVSLCDSYVLCCSFGASA